ncbi:Hyaluronan synthase 1 [Cytospora mali]|uniref:Hyaluronan synthase 1 n=1 Tax=Cytospora mali TaxID=578113 RepID=A0A194VRG2_CYTMA|nr:Hyaluronan synthase 1 [Valsa mali]
MESAPITVALLGTRFNATSKPLSQFTTADLIFILLFTFRYLRFVVHTITGVFLYKPAQIKEKPRYTSKDVAVIIPTVAPNTDAFLRCCETVLFNLPRLLVIATVGIKLEQDVLRIIDTHKLKSRFPDTEFIIVKTDQANKRKQMSLASSNIDPTVAPITVCVDDHVYWGTSFLKSLLAAFEDPKVGFVGTNKKVIRDTAGGLWKSYTNFLACIYLTRHNFQIRSEPYIDGGVFVISGRTSAVRTEILRNKDFRAGFQNERFLFGLLGPLNPDDDNYITRWVLRNGWKIRIQYTPECKIVTPLGDPRKFYGQTRTTWRSNLASLRRWHTWRHFPWSVYAIYISSLFNFAIVWDPLLVWSLTRTSFYLGAAGRDGWLQALMLVLMVMWILGSKMVKIAPHFWDHPSDLVWLPGYLAFAYWHSLVKFYCGLTFWDHAWNGRNLALTEMVSVKNMEKEQLQEITRPQMFRGTTGLYGL